MVMGWCVVVLSLRRNWYWGEWCEWYFGVIGGVFDSSVRSGGGGVLGGSKWRMGMERLKKGIVVVWVLLKRKEY